MTQKLLGPDGVSLRTISPLPGTGQSSASAKGAGGGLGEFGFPKAELSSTANVTAT